jgi:Family of unknown function (DUF5706)
MLGALVAVLSGTPFLQKGMLAWVALAAATLGCVASIGMAALAGYPRPGHRQGSVVFFGSIAGMSREEYFERLTSASQYEFARDLADQCHRVAMLAAFKFRWVTRAMWMLMLAALPWLLCLGLAGRLRI